MRQRDHMSRLFRKIDITVDGVYVSTTRQAPTCKEAAQRYRRANPFIEGKVSASFRD